MSRKGLSSKQQVLKPCNPVYLDEIIDVCVGVPQSSTHKELCCWFMQIEMEVFEANHRAAKLGDLNPFFP